MPSNAAISIPTPGSTDTPGEASLVYDVIKAFALFFHTLVTTLISMTDAVLVGSILPIADFVIAWGKWFVRAYWGGITTCGRVVVNLTIVFFKALYTVYSFLISWIMGYGHEVGSSVRAIAVRSVRAIAVRAATTGTIVTPKRSRKVSDSTFTPTDKMTDKEKMAAANKPGFDQRPGPLPLPADNVLKRSLAAKAASVSFEVK